MSERYRVRARRGVRAMSEHCYDSFDQAQATYEEYVSGVSGATWVGMWASGIMQKHECIKPNENGSHPEQRVKQPTGDTQ